MPITEPAATSHTVCSPLLTLEIARSIAIRNTSAETTPLRVSIVITVKTEKPSAECPLGQPPLSGVPFLKSILMIITREITETREIKVICQGDC